MHEKPRIAADAMTLHPLRPLLFAALLFAHAPAHAASFDCNRGRSLTERMICHDPALSKLDDTLGQLYWKARRRVIDRRAFVADSNSKWAWREANCRDAACLGTWYAMRIDELQTQLASMQQRMPSPVSGPAATPAATPAVMPADPSKEAAPTPTPLPAPLPLSAPLRTQMAAQQCTAANPGIVMNEQCPTVLKEHGSQWKYQPRGRDWFCGVAMLAPAEISIAEQTAR